jgi:PhnB protein
MPDAAARAPVRLFTAVPYLRVDNAARAIAFYTAVFGARLVTRLVEPNGRVAHAELRLGADGEASLLLSEEYPELGLRAPRALGGSAVALQLYVDDVDAVCTRAAAAGGSVRKQPAPDPFGDRAAKLFDPCGHEWLVATRMETISPDEMEARFARLFAGATPPHS